MLHYLQYRPDKQEAWQLVHESQLDNQPQKPAYISVLSVDKDVEAVEAAGESVLETVKYFGPMYFDLDNADDIDAVLDSTRELIFNLTHKLGIPKQFLHCYLSGGKGVHITIPQAVFGVKRPVKYLPLIYKQIAKGVEVENLDMSVYSASRGRLWRCEHVPRPGSGTYKVGVTPDELEHMDAEMYMMLVSDDRPSLEREFPGKTLSFAKAELAYKSARQSASKIANAIKTAKVIPSEKIQALVETPGCIEKLIKEGDCSDSTYNQAAMQIAAWVSVRYERKDEEAYMAEVVEPFLTNVESSSRNEKERRKHVKEQIGRAFAGRTKFSVGPLIATLGEPCHACPLCRGDFDIDDFAAEQAGDRYDPQTKIKEGALGYYAVAEDRARQLTSFTFQPEYDLCGLEENVTTGQMEETPRLAMVGTLTDDKGRKHYEVSIPEDAWASRSVFSKVIAGHGSCRLLCNDAELGRIGLAILHWRDQAENGGDIDVITNTKVCGIHFDKTSRGRMIPTYIEASASICAVGDPAEREAQASRFRFHGKRSHCPSLIDADYPYEDDVELIDTLRNMMAINEPENVARIVGWFAACHLREHIHHNMPQFPLLNVWGNASAGKTMTCLLVAHLCGMDYQSKCEPLNAETATQYPLTEFVTNSTTVPRLIEEVNENNMSTAMYQRVLGLFKAAWNRASANRGRIGKSGQAESDDRRVSSPIVYVSEQHTTRPSLRNRTVEVMLTSKAREVPGRSVAFKTAYRNRLHLQRAAKAMLHRALTTSPDEAWAMLEANDHLVNPDMDERPRFSMLVVLMGLDFMNEALLATKVDVSSEIAALKESLLAYMVQNHAKDEQTKRLTEVDFVLQAYDMMAADPEDRQTGLKCDEHYYRIGDSLFLNIPLCMARYRRWCRAVGEAPTIVNPDQMTALLEGELFFDRISEDLDKPGVQYHVVNLHMLRARGLSLPNFRETNAA